MTFRLSSNKVNQNINCVYCFPDQVTGEVLSIDDRIWRPYLRFKCSYPGFPSGIFQQMYPTSEFIPRIYIEFATLNVLFWVSKFWWIRLHQRQVLPAGGFRPMVLRQDMLHLVFKEGIDELWNLRSPRRNCRKGNYVLKRKRPAVMPIFLRRIKW